MKRVVVTGMGMLSSAGVGVEQFWNALLTSGREIAEPVLKVEIPQVLKPGLARRMDRFSYMTLAAGKMALEDSGILESEPDLNRVGTVFTTAYGALASNVEFARKLLTAGPNLTSPTVFASTVANACIGHTCMNLGLKGASTMLMGSSAVGYGFDVLRAGRADALLAGGIEEYHESVETSFRQKGFLETGMEPGAAVCRPLDKNRQGVALREGAAVLVMETLEHAEARGANILGEVLGYGGGFSAISPERAVEPIDSKYFADAMITALSDAGIAPERIDAVVMAAGGSRGGDYAEAMALHDVFGERGRTIPVTTSKGLTGEALGATASMGIATAILAVAHQTLPPTAGYAEADERLQLNVVAGSQLAGEYRYVLVNGYDIGGNIASLVLAAKGEQA